MQTDLSNLNDFHLFIQKNKAALVYFSTPECNVCKVLKPKVAELLKNDFQVIAFGYVDCDRNKVAAAQNSVFTVPTLILFVGGKEVLRKSRNIALMELNDELGRIVSFLD